MVDPTFGQIPTPVFSSSAYAKYEKKTAQRTLEDVAQVINSPTMVLRSVA